MRAGPAARRALSAVAAAAAPFAPSPHALRVTRAFVRALAPDFAAAALRSDASGAPIDGARAAAQHGAFVAAVRAALGGGADAVTELAAAPGCADSVFVEDTAVVLGGRAFLTAPGAPSRAGEVAGVRAALERAGVPVVGALPLGGRATLDGGDVLFTGREVFVGLGARTNAAGAAALRAAFPGLRVTDVPLGALGADVARAERARLAHPSAAAARAAIARTPLHLKSLVTVVGDDTLVVPDSPLGRAVAHALADTSGVPRAVRAGGGKLSFVLVPAAEAAAANAVLVNSTLLIRSAAEAPGAARELSEYAAGVGLTAVQLDMSELAKADGALSCCALLF